MPKYKLRRSGEEGRIHKGKCASVINFDISEQCVDEQKVPVNCDGDVDYQAKTDEESTKLMHHDTRTFEEIMLCALDDCNSKSFQIRSDALTTIGTQLQLTHNPDFLKTHNDRLLNVIQKALDSNVPCEIDAAASVIALAAIQRPEINRSFQIFYQPLKAILSNYEYLKSSIRFTVYRAVGILTFLYETDSHRIAKVINEFKELFAHEANNNENLTKINYESQVAALETCTFLMTLLPSGCKDVKPFFCIQNSVETFLTHLVSRCYGMRVACAKAIAVNFECGLEKDKDRLECHLTEIIEQVSMIIRVHNVRKSDIKSPMEVRHYLERGLAPHREVKIGNKQMNLNSWAVNTQYEMLCSVIGSANVTKHLAKNKKLLTKLMAQAKKKSYYVPRQRDTHLSNASNEPKWITSTPASQKEYDFEKISNYLQLATHKSSVERTRALEAICKEFHLVPHTFLEDQKNVILDIIVKAMKRGDDDEQLQAVQLATFTVFQLGRTERFCSEISNLFLSSLKHSSSSFSTNASICSAFAFIELVDNEPDNRLFLEPAMGLFRQIFTGTHSSHKTLKDDGATIVLRTKALEAWGLLLTLCSPKGVCSIVKSQQIKELTDLLLQNSSVEFRLVCAQVISLIIERGRISDSNYLKADITDICYAVKDIINERKNGRGDKRLLLNTNLREVLKYLEDGCHPSFMLRFSNEIHELNTWSSIFKHHRLSQFIGQNLATHLVDNERLRAIISIGPKPVGRTFLFELPPNTQYKLSSAAKKKSRAREIRMNGRTPKYDCL